jgi:glucose-6-phosphate-specific signal transduction histidine kinase
MTQFLYAFLLILSLILGTVLLSYAFGWQVGVGVGLLTYFHKSEAS